MRRIEDVVEDLITLIKQKGEFTLNSERLVRFDVEEISDYIKELEEKLEEKEVIHLKVKRYIVYEDGSLNMGFIDETDHHFINNDDMLSFSGAVSQEIGFISIVRKD